MHAPATLEILDRVEAHVGALPRHRALLDAVRVTSLAPRQRAFGEDEACPRLFVVQSGLFKQLYTRDDGTEWIKSFAREGDLFACPLALTSGGRTTFASVAIEPSVVEWVEWRVIEQLGETDIAWQKAIRIGFQRLAELKVRRERDLLMLSAEALYRQFVADAPDLASRVPQKDLAAFLGVTPVGLNRIIRRSRRAATGGDESASASASAPASGLESTPSSNGSKDG
jgi:CRP-like cAMP-binding protein